MGRRALTGMINNKIFIYFISAHFGRAANFEVGPENNQYKSTAGVLVDHYWFVVGDQHYQRFPTYRIKHARI